MISTALFIILLAIPTGLSLLALAQSVSDGREVRVPARIVHRTIAAPGVEPGIRSLARARLQDIQVDIPTKSIAMPTSYSIAPISPETLDRAFPLLRAIAPALTQEEWRRHCRKLTTPLADNDPATSREETVVAVNSQGYVKGLCLYSIRDHWIYGRLLDVSHSSTSPARRTPRGSGRLCYNFCRESATDRLLRRPVLDDGRIGLGSAPSTRKTSVGRTTEFPRRRSSASPRSKCSVGVHARRSRGHRSTFPVKT